MFWTSDVDVFQFTVSLCRAISSVAHSIVGFMIAWLFLFTVFSPVPVRVKLPCATLRNLFTFRCPLLAPQSAHSSSTADMSLPPPPAVALGRETAKFHLRQSGRDIRRDAETRVPSVLVKIRRSVNKLEPQYNGTCVSQVSTPPVGQSVPSAHPLFTRDHLGRGQI